MPRVSKQREKTASYNTSWLVRVQTTQTPQYTGRTRRIGDMWWGLVSNPKNKPHTEHNSWTQKRSVISHIKRTTDTSQILH